MNLLEILEAKTGKDIRRPKAQSTIPSQTKILAPSLSIQSSFTEVEEISYLSAGKYLSPSLFSPSFLSIYSILISNPYQYILAFREFRDFILEDNQYVLNTFPSLNMDRIFNLYMQHNSPSSPFQLHQLWISLSELHLCVPSLYQLGIEDIIQKNRG
jgi:hypothetical protein